MRRREDPHRSESGYNMVALVVAITVVTVMTAAAFPLWSGVSQRDREEELIFRVIQYAEACRVFHLRFGRYPVRLEELVEVEPRSIRQLWQDPMTDDGEWELVFDGGPGRQIGNPGDPNNPSNPDDGRNPGGARRGATPGGRPSTLPRSRGGGAFDNGRQAVGPIVGVRSRATEPNAIKVFQDQQSYDQWVVRAADLAVTIDTPDQAPQVPHGGRYMRPFPQGVTPVVNFTAAADQLPPGGAPGTAPTTGGAAEDDSRTGGTSFQDRIERIRERVRQQRQQQQQNPSGGDGR